jgi:hypothetical protein
MEGDGMHDFHRCFLGAMTFGVLGLLLGCGGDEHKGVCEMNTPSTFYTDSPRAYSCHDNPFDLEDPEAQCVTETYFERHWWPGTRCDDLGYQLTSGNDIYYASEDHLTPGACGAWGDNPASCGGGGGGGGGGTQPKNPCAQAYCPDLLDYLADKLECDVTAAKVPSQVVPFNQRDSYLVAAQLQCWTAGCINAQRAVVKSQYGYTDAQIDASLADYCASITTNVDNALNLCSDSLCLGNDDCGNGQCSASCETCCWGGSLACPD